MKVARKINIIVFLIWACLISILLYRNYAGIELKREKILSPFFDKKTYWYDIYQGKEKIGSASTLFERAGDEIIIQHEREIDVIRAHSKEKTKFIQKLKCLTDLSYSIKSFEFSGNILDKKGFQISGKVEDNDIILFLGSSKKRRPLNVTLGNKGFYVPLTLMQVIHQTIPAADMKLIVPMLNFSELKVNDTTVVLEEIRPVKVGMNINNIYRFRLGDLIIWTNEKGIIMKEQLSDRTLYYQLKEIAENGQSRPIFDFTSIPFFVSNKSIPEPEELKLLKLKLKGFRFDPRLYENSLVVLENDIITIRKKEIELVKTETYSLPYSDFPMNQYVLPDRWVLSDYKPLEDTGRIYAKSMGNDAFRFASYINNYVYSIIRTNTMFVLTDAKDILKSLRGDYLEKTVMFASYARAAGLPTRLVSGLVCVNGYFYFHAWPEVWFGQWIPADPVLLQFPADATHIPLKSGTLDDIVSIIDDLREIEIEVLETS